MIFTRNPLDKMRLIQPFGVNYSDIPDFYTKIGLKAHNGWDLSTDGVSGKPCYAVADGTVIAEGDPSTGYGLNARLYVDNGVPYQLEVVYGHLQKVTKTGAVKIGDQIGECDNTGYSTGPHLHFGIRLVEWVNGNKQVLDYDNGYSGAVDPAQFFPKSVFDLPVDKKYGNEGKPEVPSVLSFAPSFLYFLKTQKRGPTFQEYNALRFGFWDLRSVLDPAMYTVWTQYTKPEAVKLGIVK